ncbi:hypothetical protein COZ55_00325 [archaeon CG_4_8_14_3_um_filter_38_5]|nr:MAG: hypothetical protein COS83_03440 [archaeon CG07_land_8_20_14_0_80_38_8]PIX44503.1 MAG: hypothetical protein COZ55_00325 [archaeon CG_4_8_14_3_um_filter_38_5]
MAKPEKVNYWEVSLGLSLLAIGLIFFLEDLGIINFEPSYIIVVIGVLFLIGYSKSENWGLIIPGVILTLSGFTLLLDLEAYYFIWPAIVGIAFLTVYMTKQKLTQWAIIPGLILASIAIMSSFEYFTNISILPLLLIIAGFYLILNKKK